jgi:regulatory factor X, other
MPQKKKTTVIADCVFLFLSLLFYASPIDCGIRPATTTEAEWLQDYIQKSNNTAGQSSVNAARLANEQAHQRSVEPSDEDDDEDSEDPSSVAGGSSSKRNSLVLNPDTKAHLAALGVVDELADKTPTAANLLAQAQASHRPPSSFPQATIRRASAQDTALALGPSPAAATAGAPTQFVSPQPPTVVSVRHLPHFPSIEEAVGAGSTSPQGAAAREVWGWFLDHLDVLLESVRHYRFDQFEMRLRSFWTGLTGDHREIVHAPAIAGLMARADAIVYDVRVFLFILLLLLLLSFICVR